MKENPAKINKSTMIKHKHEDFKFVSLEDGSLGLSITMNGAGVTFNFSSSEAARIKAVMEPPKRRMPKQPRWG